MARRLPLEGVRVVDFCWVGAGSYATKLLADLGAEVIKIESTRALDSLRLAAPFKDGIKGPNRSGYFADRNSGKRSITVNMKHADGVALVHQLIQSANVVANNFTPGAMDRLGVGYETVQSLNPGVVYISMSMNGSEGPDRDMLGYGITIGAITGFLGLSGPPSGPPTGSGTNYPDHVPNPCHAAFAILAALRHSRRTGEGQFIDMAQTEPMLALMPDGLMDLQVNGREARRTGNRLAGYAPRGVFHTLGEDRWIAISISTDGQWAALCQVLGLEDVSDWAAGSARERDQDCLEVLLQTAIAGWDGYELMAALQACGVPAGVVQNAADLVDRDPQLNYREHWRTLPHPEMGASIYNGSPFKFASSFVGPRTAAPCLGADTVEICQAMLGLSAADVDRLIQDEALV